MRALPTSKSSLSYQRRLICTFHSRVVSGNLVNGRDAIRVKEDGAADDCFNQCDDDGEAEQRQRDLCPIMLLISYDFLVVF